MNSFFQWLEQKRAMAPEPADEHSNLKKYVVSRHRLYCVSGHDQIVSLCDRDSEVGNVELVHEAFNWVLRGLEYSIGPNRNVERVARKRFLYRAGDGQCFGGGDDENASLLVCSCHESVPLVESFCEHLCDLPPDGWVSISKLSELRSGYLRCYASLDYPNCRGSTKRRKDCSHLADVIAWSSFPDLPTIHNYFDTPSQEEVNVVITSALLDQFLPKRSC